jgi:hypothetical protein
MRVSEMSTYELMDAITYHRQHSVYWIACAEELARRIDECRESQKGGVMGEELKRFIITTKDGQWVATVYAEKFVSVGAKSGDFFIGDNPVGSVDTLNYLVSDSGGRPNWTIQSQKAAAEDAEAQRRAEEAKRT